MDKIPVIGVAIVNGVHWFERLINSIDYPVSNLVIWNNNGKGELDTQLDLIKQIKHPLIDKIHICNLPQNIGVSGAWNMTIKSFAMEPYWILVNHDVAFTEGFLEEMVDHTKDNEIGMVHGKVGDFDLPSYDLFLIKDWVIKEFGLFDENLYPAYCEDADYIMRMMHRPIKVIKNISKGYYHGESMDYYKTGSQTRKADPELEQKLIKVNIKNFEYLNKKWGEGWRTCNPYTYPFDTLHIPITYTSWDIDYIRQKHLGF